PRLGCRGPGPRRGFRHDGENPPRARGGSDGGPPVSRPETAGPVAGRAAALPRLRRPLSGPSPTPRAGLTRGHGYPQRAGLPLPRLPAGPFPPRRPPPPTTTPPTPPPPFPRP